MEERLAGLLSNKFSFLENRVKVQRARRILADVDFERFEELLVYSFHGLQFTMLCTITGLDEGDRFGLIYHLAREDGIMMNIKTYVPRASPVIKTIMPYFQNAEIYERELVDLLGIAVDGLPEGNRYPLPDGWPADEYPLRKDWKTDSDKKIKAGGNDA